MPKLRSSFQLAHLSLADVYHTLNVKPKDALLKGSNWVTSRFRRYIARHWTKDMIHNIACSIEVYFPSLYLS
jgi:hypothetical protein